MITRVDHKALLTIITKISKISSCSFVCVTEQHRVSIFCTRVWFVAKATLFRYIGRLVTSQQNVTFILSTLHFWLQFGFVFIRMRSWNLEISGFCVWKIRGLPTDHTQVKKNRNAVLFCNTDRLIAAFNYTELWIPCINMSTYTLTGRSLRITDLIDSEC